MLEFASLKKSSIPKRIKRAILLLGEERLIKAGKLLQKPKRLKKASVVLEETIQLQLHNQDRKNNLKKTSK